MKEQKVMENNTHCVMGGLKDAHVGYCSRWPASAASLCSAVHQHQQEGGEERRWRDREGGSEDDDDDDVKAL